jgi:hypothetical protein
VLSGKKITLNFWNIKMKKKHVCATISVKSHMLLRSQSDDAAHLRSNFKEGIAFTEGSTRL